MDDRQKIQQVIEDWMRATKAGNIDQILPLMDEDIVFLVPGHPPMQGRDAFAANFKAASQNVWIEPSSEIQEIQIAGDWAFCWNHLTVKVTPRDGNGSMVQAGYTLSIFRKLPDGRWVLARDANLLAQINNDED